MTEREIAIVKYSNNTYPHSELVVKALKQMKIEYVTCLDCNGSGKRANQECIICDGTGKVET